MFITLIFFIIGTTIGAAHLPFWTEEMPSMGSFSLATSTNLGYGGALIVSLLIFGLIACISKAIEKKRNSPKVAPLPSARGWKRFSEGHGL